MNQKEFENFLKTSSLTPEERANHIIEREQINQSGFLDLSNLDLKNLPVEIASCTWLKGLILGEVSLKKSINWNLEVDFGLNDLLDISLLSKLENLEVLFLGGLFNLRDISSLQNLHKLRIVELQCTKINELDALKNMFLLEKINLSWTKVVTLDPLLKLTQLKAIDARSTFIYNLKPLTYLKKLEFLDLGHGAIYPIESKWVGLSVQKGNYSLNEGQIEDLSPLQGLKNLRTLNLYGRKIVDLNPIMQLDNLIVLNLTNVNGSKKVTKCKLYSLRKLTIFNTEISDLNFIRSATKLEQLHLQNLPISEISWVQNLTQLIFLSMRKLDVQNLGGIEALEKLQMLHLGDLPLQSLAPISALKRLGQLNLSNLQLEHIVDLKPPSLTFLLIKGIPLLEINFIQYLRKLSYLNIETTKISSITPIEALQNLSELMLKASPIKHLNGLAKCLSLRNLKIDALEISDLPEILTELSALTSIDARFKRKDGHVQHLSKKGSNKEVTDFLKQYFSESFKKENSRINLKVPASIRIAIKQYFQYFESYLVEVKGINHVAVDVISNQDGLEVMIKSSKANFNEEAILKHFEVYQKLALLSPQEVSDNLAFEDQKPRHEKEIAKLGMKQQIQLLHHQLELKKLEIKYLEKALNRTEKQVLSITNKPIYIRQEANLHVENTISVMVNNFIEQVQPRINEIQEDQFLSEDQKTQEIGALLDEAVEIQKESKYRERLEYWMPNLDKLDKLSQKYLVSSEFLLDVLQKANAEDYAPFLIQQCRAVENELKKQLFVNYHEKLHQLSEEKRELLLAWDLEGGSGRNKALAKMFQKESLSKLMIGTMVMTLMKMSIHNEWNYGGNLGTYYWDEASHLKQNQIQFIANICEVSEILDKSFIEDLEYIRKNYRNKAAHPNENEIAFNLKTIKPAILLLRKWLVIWSEILS